MEKVKTYSQVGQDKWILSLFPKGYKGFFMDLGCNDPQVINNTLLLEEQGWEGVAFDITDLEKEWVNRNALFICADVLSYNFLNIGLPMLIDYVSVDIDAIGSNHQIMKTLLDLGFEFKAITIEHNLYISEEFNQRERLPQRELLLSKGYTLAYRDVMDDDGQFNKFEDWWINSKYITL
jgi:hypothetical protein